MAHQNFCEDCKFYTEDPESTGFDGFCAKRTTQPNRVGYQDSCGEYHPDSLEFHIPSNAQTLKVEQGAGDKLRLVFQGPHGVLDVLETNVNRFNL